MKKNLAIITMLLLTSALLMQSHRLNQLRAQPRLPQAGEQWFFHNGNDKFPIAFTNKIIAIEVVGVGGVGPLEGVTIRLPLSQVLGAMHPIK